MRLLTLATWAFAAIGAVAGAATTPSTEGIEALVKRRLPQHADFFEFKIIDAKKPGEQDRYTVSPAGDKVRVEGNSLSALATGYDHPRSAHCSNIDSTRTVLIV